MGVVHEGPIWPTDYIGGHTRKSTGYDNRYAGEAVMHVAWRIGATDINFVLTKNTMRIDIFPDTLKRTDVSYVFKKDDNLNKSDFQPVSVLTGISELYESVVKWLVVWTFVCSSITLLVHVMS